MVCSGRVLVTGVGQCTDLQPVCGGRWMGYAQRQAATAR